MTNTEALKILFAFRQSIDIVTKKQDELLNELVAIKVLLQAVLSGGMDLGGGRTAEELAQQVQMLVEQKMAQMNPDYKEASEEAGQALGSFLSAIETPDVPLS